MIRDKNRFINILNEYDLSLLSQGELTEISDYSNITNEILSYDLFTDTFFVEKENSNDKILQYNDK